jgi:4-amino-4-deoxy-L-arabinose transferase-like glycosyltransferase
MNIALELLRTGRPVATMFPHTPIGEHVQITTPWLYNGFLSLFFSFFGPSIWVGRFLSFICGIPVILLIYRFGKDIAGQKAGLVASLFLAASPVFSWHSREMRQEMMLMAFVTLCMYFLFRAWKEKNNTFLFFSGFISTI